MAGEDTEASRSLVLKYLAAQSQADAGAMEALLDEQVEWAPPQSLFEPIRGRAKVLQTLGEVAGQVFEPNSLRPEVHKILADGDTVVILMSLEGKTTKGREYTNDYAWVYTVANGKIVRMQEFADSLRFDRIVNG